MTRVESTFLLYLSPIRAFNNDNLRRLPLQSFWHPPEPLRMIVSVNCSLKKESKMFFSGRPAKLLLFYGKMTISDDCPFKRLCAIRPRWWWDREHLSAVLLSSCCWAITLLLYGVSCLSLSQQKDQLPPLASPIDLKGQCHEIFEQFWNDPNVIFRGLGEDDSWKKPEAKNLVTLSLEIQYLLLFRVFDQYEIDIEVKKHRHSYLGKIHSCILKNISCILMCMVCDRQFILCWKIHILIWGMVTNDWGRDCSYPRLGGGGWVNKGKIDRAYEGDKGKIDLVL